jgi:hypothetical protein
MLRRLRVLHGLAGVRSRVALGDLDFGDVVAVLIVMLGLMSFASVGLWTPS